MITDEVTQVIKCITDAEFVAEKERIQALPNLQPSVEYNDILKQIILRQTSSR